MIDTIARSGETGIAIVEDERDLVELLIRLFKQKGIPIEFIARDGFEAVEKYKASNPRPHVILIDYRLPVLDGIECMTEIKKIHPDAKFIFLSADVYVKAEALEAGANEFLSKPVSLHKILKAIDCIQ